MEISGLLHAPTALSSGKEPQRTHWIGDTVGPRAELDYVQKWKYLNVPALNTADFLLSRSQLLYRMSCHVFLNGFVISLLYARRKFGLEVNA
jgi:hypothetical protein